MSYVKFNDELVQLLRSTAAEDPATALDAQRALAVSVNEPLRKGVFDESNHDGIFDRMVLPPGAQANFVLDFVKPGEEDINFTAVTLPKQGRVPERHVEGDELWVPTYKIANAIDWSLDYARDGRFDIVARALDVYRKGFTRKLNEDAWHTLLAAADARGLVINDPIAQNGQFTKELISRMWTSMKRNAGGNGNAGALTDVYLSMEAVEDIRAWDESEIDDVTRREILSSAGRNMLTLYGVNLHPMTEFGVGQEYQLYMTNVLGRAVTALDAGDNEFVIGLDLSTRDSFVNPIRQELQTFPDDKLHRQQRAGFYGWMTLGWAVLDNRRLMLGTF